MLSEELKSIYEALGRLLGKTDPETAETLRQCRRNLDNAIDQADNLEQHFYPLAEAK